ncbi:MAG TPA: GTPase [Xanthomonadaceae bacterium]|nr:GTPase [Xanthomonadaceae bacterium]
MRRTSQPARWLLATVVLIVAVALVWILFTAADAALAFWQRTEALPAVLRWGLIAGIAAVGLGGAWLALRIALPGKLRAPKAAPLDRDALERRSDAIGPAAGRARAELEELDRRRAAGELYVALFGEISTGKSSLIRALLPGTAAQVGVAGGTTRAVAHYRGEFERRPLVLADVPGSNESGGQALSREARAEAGRAHALVFVADGEPTRSQDAELRAISAFGKPLALALNKIDRYSQDELDELLAALRARYGQAGATVLPVRAGGTTQVRVRGGDGDEGILARTMHTEVTPLREWLSRLARGGAAELEPARESAVLAAVEGELAHAERALAGQRSEQAVRRYTRRAILGALAAIAPGTDLVIQGALAAALTRELAAIHGLKVRDVDIDAFLARAGGTVRTTTSVTLAIAGNALKAFPGLGTLGGGLVHAVAYGLIFDSLGRALASTFAETGALDREATLEAFRDRMAGPADERLREIARLAWDAWRKRSQAPDNEPAAR